MSYSRLSIISAALLLVSCSTEQASVQPNYRTVANRGVIEVVPTERSRSSRASVRSFIGADDVPQRNFWIGGLQRFAADDTDGTSAGAFRSSRSSRRSQSSSQSSRHSFLDDANDDSDATTNASDDYDASDDDVNNPSDDGSSTSRRRTFIGSGDCPSNRSFLGFADDGVAVQHSDRGWVFPVLLNGDCPITAGILEFGDGEGVFGRVFAQ